MKKSLLSILAVLIFAGSGVAQYVPSSMVAGIIKGTVTNFNRLPVWASTNNLYNQDMYWCKYGTNVYPAGLYRYTRTTKATNWTIFGQGNPIKDKNWITNSFLDRVRWTVNSNSMTKDFYTDNLTVGNNVGLFNSSLSNRIYKNGSGYLTFSVDNIDRLNIRKGSNPGINILSGSLYVDGVRRIMSSGEIRATAGTSSTPSLSFAGDIDTGLSAFNANQLSFVTGGVERATLESSGFFVNVALLGTFTNYRTTTQITNSYLAKSKWTINSNVLRNDYINRDSSVSNSLWTRITGVSNGLIARDIAQDTAMSNALRAYSVSLDTAQSNIVYLRYADYASTNFVNNNANSGFTNSDTIFSNSTTSYETNLYYSFTPASAGYYEISFSELVAVANTNSVVGVSLNINGTNWYENQSYAHKATDVWYSISGKRIHYLSGVSRIRVIFKRAGAIDAQVYIKEANLAVRRIK